jgi:CRP/FNR family cyclic AMP-dependent transcriptional regulator
MSSPPSVRRTQLAPANGMATVHLLEVEPDLGRDLDSEQWSAARQLRLPVQTVSSDGADVDATLVEARAFGALVLEGMLARRIRVDGHAALRLLGPGDIYLLGAEPASALLAQSSCSAVPGTRLALLNSDLLVATYRWPRLVAGLLRRVAEQGERTSLQLAVGHLPRVDERLLAMFELIAEQWGVVTPHGRMIRLALTHETLGGLVGARRSTVSLALRTLADRDELIRTDDGWLLRNDVTARRLALLHEPRTSADIGPSAGSGEDPAPVLRDRT